MSFTVRDVARLAGVSPSTVSRALSRPEMISAGTRERVLDAARTLGWVPSRVARSLTSGVTRNIGVVVPDIVNPFFPPLIRGAQQEAWRRGFGVLLGDSDEDREREMQVAEELAAQVDGIVLMSSRLSGRQVASLRERCEVVLVNRVVRGARCVLVDSAPSVRKVVRHFASCGHRAAHYVSGPEGSWSNGQRLAAFEEECDAVGIAQAVLAPSVGAFERGRACVDDLLAAGATAVLAYDDITAIGILAGLAERGVRVPRDVSVVGCDDIPMAGQLGLATIGAPAATVGALASGLLVDGVLGSSRSEPPSGRTVRVPTTLLLRRSAGPATGARSRAARDRSHPGGSAATRAT
ncbi:MAG: LacI family DNA-binding transcriptional regulator [Actinomycetota bacterium]|nr:LacI family DNA-binding transcriptional regulator [Actinomycetota bacterium]